VTAFVEICHSIEEVVLVLEAPLSAAFDCYGNPRPRGNFEREPLSRWWSVGPGAATTLSALFFLRELKLRLTANDIAVHLVEGFVTGDDSVDHDQVATALREGFRGKQKCNWHSVTNEGTVISAIEWVNCEPHHKPPVILQPIADHLLPQSG
jgi:hypothetical protein